MGSFLFLAIVEVDLQLFETRWLCVHVVDWRSDSKLAVTMELWLAGVGSMATARRDQYWTFDGDSRVVKSQIVVAVLGWETRLFIYPGFRISYLWQLQRFGGLALLLERADLLLDVTLTDHLGLQRRGRPDEAAQLVACLCTIVLQAVSWFLLFPLAFLYMFSS